MNSIRMGRILSAIFWRSIAAAVVLGFMLYGVSIAALIFEAPRP